MNFKFWALLAAVLGLGCQNAKAQVPSLDGARQRFKDAYDNVDYKGLCAVLHKEATFRGKLDPNTWTLTSDKIVTDRWHSKYTCTEMANGAPNERKADPRQTVGESDINLTPTDPPRMLDLNGYALDNGVFVMMPKVPGRGREISGSYVVLWRFDSDWKIMHIDMASTP